MRKNYSQHLQDIYGELETLERADEEIDYLYNQEMEHKKANRIALSEEANTLVGEPFAQYMNTWKKVRDLCKSQSYSNEEYKMMQKHVKDLPVIKWNIPAMKSLIESHLHPYKPNNQKKNDD